MQPHAPNDGESLPPTSIGTLYGVGLGPGALDLLTMRAFRVISATRLLAVPVKAVGADSFARSIVADLITDQQEVLELTFPMRSDPEVLRPHWEKAGRAVAERLAGGESVAFLCEGDPFTFGTFIYVFREVCRLLPQAPVEVIPGISAYHAAAARTLMPLAAGDDRVAILPATYGVEIVGEMLERFDTVVLLKVKPVMDQLIDLLEERGLAKHAVFVNKVGTDQEQVVADITTLKGHTPDYLSLVLARNPERLKEPVLRGCRKK
ncbi:MAG: precorrin-2 C(20)-methyltransferase [Nitrospirota bacterium]|nr:precorrin-2 C(20)-methyltransferase [Nitrospirota bacterium]